MKKIIEHAMPYAMSCETRRYLGCFASVVMCMENYDGTQPVFCNKCRGFCENCGECENIVPMQRSHEEFYHLYLTVSGMGVLYFDLDSINRDHDELTESLLSDSVDVTMRYAGYTYRKLSRDLPENVVCDQMVTSINRGIPVIFKTTGGCSILVTGYDEEGAVIYGYDGYGTYLGTPLKPDGYTEENRFIWRNWYENLSSALIVTSKSNPSFTLKDVFNRLISILESRRSNNCGHALFDLFDDEARFSGMDSTELREIYDFTNALIGYLAETRAFVSDNFNINFMNTVTHTEIKEIGYQIAKLCCHSHDTAWNAWTAIGAWEQGDHIDRLRNAEIRQVVKTDLKKIIENDMQVLDKLKQCIRLFE